MRSRRHLEASFLGTTVADQVDMAEVALGPQATRVVSSGNLNTPRWGWMAIGIRFLGVRRYARRKRGGGRPVELERGLGQVPSRHRAGRGRLASVREGEVEGAR